MKWCTIKMVDACDNKSFETEILNATANVKSVSEKKAFVKNIHK